MTRGRPPKEKRFAPNPSISLFSNELLKGVMRVKGHQYVGQAFDEVAEGYLIEMMKAKTYAEMVALMNRLISGQREALEAQEEQELANLKQLALPFIALQFAYERLYMKFEKANKLVEVVEKRLSGPPVFNAEDREEIKMLEAIITASQILSDKLEGSGSEIRQALLDGAIVEFSKDFVAE